MQNLVAILLIVSTGVLVTACQKKSVTEFLHAAEMKPTAAPVKSHGKSHVKSALNEKDLGILPLSNHVSTTVSIGENKECTITPTLLRNGNLQLILAMTTTGRDGRPLGVNVARVLAEPGKPFDVAIGDVNLAFTPQLAMQ